jgi:hypothetical protein
VPPALGLGIDTAYISVGTVKATRLSDIGGDQGRTIELPYQVTSRPIGRAQAPVIWSDVATKYPTSWAAIPAGTTWAQLANPTG